MKNYNFSDTVASLDRKRDLHISMEQQTMFINKGECRANDIGNRSWGKIDFLKRQGLKEVFMAFDNDKKWNEFKRNNP